VEGEVMLISTINWVDRVLLTIKALCIAMMATGVGLAWHYGYQGIALGMFAYFVLDQLDSIRNK
jgi:hypothetical protein